MEEYIKSDSLNALADLVVHQLANKMRLVRDMGKGAAEEKEFK